MKRYQRVFVIVLDSLGIGEMEDSSLYGDVGVDTLGHIVDSVDDFQIPNLQKFGLANLHPLKRIKSVAKPMAKYCAMKEKSIGKDTVTGHWEMMGIETKTKRQEDAASPPGKTVLDALEHAGYDVISVGKIYDIFNGQGLTEQHKSVSSVKGMQQTITIAKEEFQGLCFTNLVDFEVLWGQQRDPAGYARELEMFDKNLEILRTSMRERDLLILTADHGSDPTYKGTDHTREKVPFLAWSPSMKEYGAMKETDSFAVIGATIADNFRVPMPEGTIGHSILEQLQ